MKLSADEIHEIAMMICDIGEESIPKAVSEIQRGILSSFYGLIAARIGIRLTNECKTESSREKNQPPTREKGSN